MDRRMFLGTMAGGLLAEPLAAWAQQARSRKIAFLGAGSPSTSANRIKAFSQRLGELGWVEGRNIEIEYRWAEGRSERFTEIATELVRLKAEVIVTWGTATVAAAKRATSTIPIVFALAADPVATGLVASLARPGGNVTGLSAEHTDSAGKRLGRMREVAPRLRRVAILVNPDNVGTGLEARQIVDVERQLNLEVLMMETRRVDEIASALQTLKGQADALFVVADAFLNTQRTRINRLALAERLPTIYAYGEAVAAGALMSYGPDYLDLFRRSAEYVDKILKGAKPADLPVEQPTKFELVINLKTAKALGLRIPPSLLARADQVIE